MDIEDSSENDELIVQCSNGYDINTIIETSYYIVLIIGIIAFVFMLSLFHREYEEL